MSRRVAVVGLGVKAPGGCSVSDLWARLLDPKTMAAPQDFGYDLTMLEAAKIACEITDDDSGGERYFSKSELRRIDPVIRMGMAAAVDAVDGAAGEVLAAADPTRRACIIGTGIGGIQTFAEQSAIMRERGVAGVSPFAIPMTMANAMPGLLSMKLDLRGPTSAITLACASSTVALGDAMNLIRSDRADVVIAGGMEASRCAEGFVGFARIEALSTHAGDPSEASRPFSADRSGFVIGEGGAMLTLCSEELAASTGAPVLGWIDGFGTTTDAHHMVAPRPDAAGAATSMQLALADAGLAPTDIGHINAHGTSTFLNDQAESLAIETVFGDHRPAVTATKGVTGHLIGGSGAVEAIATVLATSTGIVPPIANTTEIDPELSADGVVGEPRSIGPAPALSNSFAFGGHNATIAISPGSVESLGL